MIDHVALRDHLLILRRDAIHRGEAIFFRPLPLFVILAHAMADEAIYGCIEHAIDDGYGDPEDLDASDERQTSRLETAILEGADSIKIEELLTIEFAGWPSGSQCSLCVAEIGEDGVLVVHRPDDVPAFMAIGVGESAMLLEELRLTPQTLLPRLEADNDRIAEVAIRRSLPLTVGDVALVVLALTGCTTGEAHIVRGDLLAGVRPSSIM